MTDEGDGGPDTGEDAVDWRGAGAGGQRTGAAVHGATWEATIEDTLSLSEDFEADGWEVVTLIAGDTAAEAPASGASDRFGLTYVVPDNKAEPFVEAFERGTFPRYEVYRAERDGRVFLTTALLDPGSETAILLAGSYDPSAAAGCLRAAAREGAMYTHVELLDGTHLGSFRHERYEKFVPEDAQPTLGDESA